VSFGDDGKSHDESKQEGEDVASKYQRGIDEIMKDKTMPSPEQSIAIEQYIIESARHGKLIDHKTYFGGDTANLDHFEKFKSQFDDARFNNYLTYKIKLKQEENKEMQRKIAEEQLKTEQAEAAARRVISKEAEEIKKYLKSIYESSKTYQSPDKIQETYDNNLATIAEFGAAAKLSNEEFNKIQEIIQKSIYNKNDSTTNILKEWEQSDKEDYDKYITNIKKRLMLDKKKYPDEKTAMEYIKKGLRANLRNAEMVLLHNEKHIKIPSLVKAEQPEKEKQKIPEQPEPQPKKEEEEKKKT